MVEFRALSQPEFDAFRAQSIADYAQERVLCGDWLAAQAPAQSKTLFDELLKDGLATPRHSVWGIVETTSGQVVGNVWFQMRQRGGKCCAHLLYLFIAPECRRRGFARQAMELLMQRMAEQGAQELTLNVFGRNESAQALYASMGFDTLEVGMVKRLPAATA